MGEIRAESNGFKIYIGGTWVEISNKYGVVASGDITLLEVSSEKFAEETLEKFIRKHSIDTEMKDDLKKVAVDKETGRYIQLRILRPENDEYWWVQVFDDELVYKEEEWTGCRYKDEAADWVRSNYEIVKGCVAEVFRNSFSDCTNGGISSKYRELYILSEQGGAFEPEDIRECVRLECREIMGEECVNAKPVYLPNCWYMAGGNFLYTSNAQFRDITGKRYPIPIHDRHEGSEEK